MKVSNKFFIYPKKILAFPPKIEIRGMRRRRYPTMKDQKAQ